MKLSDHELEIYLGIYESAKGLISAKDRPDWAFKFLEILDGEGIELKLYSQEIVDTCPFLDKAMDIVLEDMDEEDWEVDYDDEWE
jgi:hypothetical protein